MAAQLTVESGTASPRWHDLNENDIARIGRATDNTIVLRDRHASRRHTRVYFEEGHWLLRDEEKTKNHTLVDGVPATDVLSLSHGQTISIGEVRLLFQTDDAEGEAETLRADEMYLVPPPKADTTGLEIADLVALIHFTNQALNETSPDELVTRALRLVLDQTGAEHAGYLAFEDPAALRLVLPADSQLDGQISERLSRLVDQKRRMVWLCDPDAGTMGGDSLAGFRDAVCVPVPGVGTEAPLGSLHAYQSRDTFTPRQARFCDVVAGSLASALHRLRSNRARNADISRLQTHTPQAGEELVGSSRAMTTLRKQIRQFASSACTVLIRGETGVGKERVAFKLHCQSPRHRGPFVAVNCATITGQLAESLLFGHVKGSFSGAIRDHAGFFAQADMGTLFLDELGDLPKDIQVKLLRALESRHFTALGAEKESSADVRVIAATNGDLEDAIERGDFREDLYYRFTGTIEVPPLRDHLEDVPELVRHFLDHLRGEYRHSVELSEGALEALASYTWPGNVRQLRCKLEAALAMAENHSTINASDFSLPKEDSGVELQDRPASLHIEDVEKWAIRQAMEGAKGNQSQAARVLGWHRSTLIDKLKRYRLG